VLATLVIQGLTLAPLVRLLKLDQTEDARRELSSARAALAKAAFGSIGEEQGSEADNLKYRFSLKERTCLGEVNPGSLDRLRELALKAIEAQREELELLRNRDQIGADAYLALQEHLDWSELTALRDDDRKMEDI
jgi:hypothetical protein